MTRLIDYLSQLKSSLGKDEFRNVFARLKADKSMEQKEMAALANEFNGPVAPSTSRVKSLERIYSRNRKLVEWI